MGKMTYLSKLLYNSLRRASFKRQCRFNAWFWIGHMVSVQYMVIVILMENVLQNQHAAKQKHGEAPTVSFVNREKMKFCKL